MFKNKVTTMFGFTRVGACCLSVAALVLAVGCSSQKTADEQKISYNNPIVEQRADPWVWKTEEGRYYFIGTSPKFDFIEIRSADTINGLKDGESKIVWRKHENGPMGNHIWAPELHRIDGVWYIHVAAAPSHDPWHIRMHVLSNPSENPMEGEWREEGQIKTERDSFSLDATTFEHRGKRYLIWAQKDAANRHNSALYISEMATPTTLTGPEVMLTEPVLPWEIIGYRVNEGAAVIKKNDRIFVTYSASATDHNYAMGLLWADEDADLLDPASWNKSPEPVFYTNPEVKRYGPGHNSFTVAEDGKTDVMIYHARDYKELQGNPLTDPNRDARARVLHWDENGFPDFQQTLAD
jgi:GH43 family beta-xylosidase